MMEYWNTGMVANEEYRRQETENRRKGEKS
jgi:hypothetical protein